jgi:hypothetical protein
MTLIKGRKMVIKTNEKKNRDGFLHLPKDFVPAKHNWGQEAYIRGLMVKVTNEVVGRRDGDDRK